MCSELVWWNIRVVETRNCHGLNFPTTIATKKAWNGTIRGIIWTQMSHTAQLDWARREGYLWSRHHRWGWSDGPPHIRQPKGCEIIPRKLCNQEASTLRVWSWRSCLRMGFTDEMHEKVWDERKVRTSLQRTFFRTWEVWTCGIQIGVTAILGRSCN